MTYLLVIIFCSSVGAGFKRLDFDGNVLLPLLVGEPDAPVLLRFGCPVLCLLCWLEGRIFSDGGVGIGVDLLDVSGSDIIGEVGRELPLEPERTCQAEKGYGC